MIRLKLTSVMVNDQNRAREFYTNILGFTIKNDIPMGEANWLTVVSPADPEGTELLLEPTGHPASKPFQKALFDDGVPITAFATDNVQAEYERLKALGVVFRGEPLDVGSTIIVQFEDGCGNLIQLFQV